MIRHLAALAGFLAISWLFYAPPAGSAGFTHAGPDLDPLAYIWFLNWFPYAAAHHLPWFYTNYVDAPPGTSLAWKACLPTLALAAAPFTRHYGALASFNGLCGISAGLASWAAYLAAMEFFADFAASLTAGLIFGFSSYMVSQWSQINLACTMAVPLCLWACFAAAKYSWGHLRLGLVLGFLLALQFGISQEICASLGVFGAATLVITYLSHPAARPAVERLLPGLALSLLVTALLTAPLLWEMLHHYGDTKNAISPAAEFSTDALNFVIPNQNDWLGGAWAAPVSAHFTGNHYEQDAYIGLPLLLLLGVIYHRHRTSPAIRVPAIVAALAAILSLGPFLHVLNLEVSTAPWLLASKMPFLSAMLPARFMLYAWLAIALLLAAWLAAPGAKLRRYAALYACLVFLLPDPGVARPWTRLALPAVLTDASIPPGASIMVLPLHGTEMGYQYAAGMRFRLAGQGYLGNGLPAPFSAWPLYQNLFDSQFGSIDPGMLAAYLATYRVDDVLVTETGYEDYTRNVELDGPASAVAASLLLRAAGWQVVRTMPGAVLLSPLRPQTPPSPAEITAFLKTPTPEHVAKLIRAERHMVCFIRHATALTHLQAAPFLAYYTAHTHPPLPLTAITCKP